MPGPVGVHHADAGAALPAVPGEDLLVHLGAPGGFHVDVDIGQLVSQWGEEPLHEQPVTDRIDVGDTQEVIDQAACPGPARGAAHPHPLDEVRDVGHREEIRRIPQVADDVELVIEPVEHRLCRRHPTAGQPGHATLPQHPVG